MANFNLTVQDAELHRKLRLLIDRLDSPEQALKPIGEQIVERIKQRFQTSTAPDGTPWQPNAPSTLQAIANGLGKSYRTKGGGLNARGSLKMTSKKPLIDTGELATNIHAKVVGDSLTITESPIYAAIHQFGGKIPPHTIRPKEKKALAFGGLVRRSVNHPGSVIPARPSMPVRIDGTLYPQEQSLIIDAINDYLTDNLP